MRSGSVRLAPHLIAGRIRNWDERRFRASNLAVNVQIRVSWLGFTSGSFTSPIASRGPKQRFHIPRLLIVDVLDLSRPAWLHRGQ
jgi:hypothetical protein